MNHSTIGAWLCKKWCMPDEIVQCVEYHQNPSRGEEDYLRIISITHLANILVRKVFSGYGGDPLVLELEDGVLDRLRLSEKDVENGEVFLKEGKEQIESMV